MEQIKDLKYPIKLNLGSGAINLGDDWISIDEVPYEHVKYISVKKLPLKDNEVEMIYASHLFAYFDREEGVDILKEWRRVLREGGKLLIAVPDFEKMAKLYMKGKYVIEDFLGPLYGKIPTSEITDTKCGLIVKNTGFKYHKTTYDMRSLSKALHKAGFTSIERKKIGFGISDKDQSNAVLPDRDIDGTLISLNLIATK